MPHSYGGWDRLSLLHRFARTELREPNIMNTRTVQIATLAFAAALAHAGTVLYSQDFSTTATTASSGYSIGDQRINSSNYFLYVNDSTSPGSDYAGGDGGFVAGRNINALSDLDYSVTTDSFDITGQSSLNFAIDLARHSDGALWASSDHVDFEYAIDGSSTWTNFSTVDTGGVNNALPLFEGVTITNTFANFSTIITGLTGTDLQIRIVWADVGLGASLAIDNITVSAVPLPPAAFAGLSVLGCLGGLRIAHRLRR